MLISFLFRQEKRSVSNIFNLIHSFRLHEIVMDPQQRLFLECAWEAMERAGYTGENGGKVSVFSSMGASSYFIHQINPSLTIEERMNGSSTFLQSLIGNNGDFLASRASYQVT